MQRWPRGAQRSTDGRPRGRGALGRVTLVCLVVALLSAALVSGSSARVTRRSRPVTGVVGKVVYSGWITYRGNDSDKRVLANCGTSGPASEAPESDHRTVHLHFRVVFPGVTLSRQGPAILERGAVASLASSTFTDRGTNYAAPAGVDPGACRSYLKKVPWSCRGKLTRPAGGFLLVRREVTDFGLELSPTELINSKPRRCLHATYPGDSPEQYPGSVNSATAADFTGYWDDQWNFAEYGLLQSLPTRWELNVHRGDFAKFARGPHSVTRDIAQRDDQNSSFTDCSAPDNPANVDDSCDQSISGHAEARFVVTRLLH